MHASSPAALSAAFAAAMGAGDLDAALELWLPDAAIIAADGRVIAGRDAVAPVLEALIDNDVSLTIELLAVYDAGETAIGTGRLTMSARNGGAEPYEHTSEALIVYRRVDGAGWRIALDAPWGLPNA
jgi:uncharacterized protein (TIGR02246 family)